MQAPRPFSCKFNTFAGRRHELLNGRLLNNQQSKDNSLLIVKVIRFNFNRSHLLLILTIGTKWIKVMHILTDKVEPFDKNAMNYKKN